MLYASLIRFLYCAISAAASAAAATTTTTRPTTTCTSFCYPHDAMLARVFAIATCLSVCLSVRLSVRHTPVLCLAERKQDREMYTI